MATRRKPVITIVEARPMTDVNFRSNDGLTKEMSKTSLNIVPPKPARPPSRTIPNTSLSLSKGKKCFNSFEALNAKKENNLIKPPIPAARKSILFTTSANTANTTKSNNEDKSNYYECETTNANDTPKQHKPIKITQSGSTDELHMPGVESYSISFAEARSRFGGNWFGNNELTVSATNLKQKGKATIIRPKSTFLNKTFTLNSLENESKTAESNVQNLSNIIHESDSGLSMKPCLPKKPTIIKPKPLSKSMILMDFGEHPHNESSAKMNLDLKSIIDYEPNNLINVEAKNESEADFIPSNNIRNIDLAGLDFGTDQDLPKNNNDSNDIYIIPPVIGSEEIAVRNLNKCEEFPETKSADRPPRPTVGPKIRDPLNLTSNTSKPQGPRALALYDYESGHVEDLSFKAGEIIMLDSTVDIKWLKGHKYLSDELGMFPSNFVQIIEPLSNEPSKAEASNDLTTSEKPRCVAKYDFEGLQENGELSFKEGDVILMNKRINDEWLGGQLDATRSGGIFPASFVEIIHDLSGAANVQTADSETKVKVIEKSFKKVVAVYDFRGGQSGDLDFVAGETIEVVGEINGDWLEGRIAERRGMFPSSFVVDQ